MGTRGRAPKRSDKRHGHRSKEDKDVTVEAGAATAGQPPPRAGWPKIVKDFYLSLGASGEAVFYEPSDWAAAQILCESMARELRPRVIGHTDDGRVIRRQQPPSAAALSAWFKAMAALMVTEADRRRLHIELKRPDPEEKPRDVVELADYARDLRSG